MAILVLKILNVQGETVLEYKRKYSEIMWKKNNNVSKLV